MFRVWISFLDPCLHFDALCAFSGTGPFAGWACFSEVEDGLAAVDVVFVVNQLELAGFWWQSLSLTRIQVSKPDSGVTLTVVHGPRRAQKLAKREGQT